VEEKGKKKAQKRKRGRKLERKINNLNDLNIMGETKYRPKI